MIVAPGSTDVSTYFSFRFTASGLEATALTITTMDLQYVRSGAAPSAKVDATALAATDSAHGDNQAIEIDATDQPGLYRVDWPDAAFASGVREVVLTVKVATAFTEHLRVTLMDLPLTAAGVRSAVGLATANLDTQLDALPTNAELSTALGTADDAVLTAIGDLPTNAELATALGTADDATLAAIAALNNLSQANIRTAVGLASANLDTQLAAIEAGSGSGPTHLIVG